MSSSTSAEQDKDHRTARPPLADERTTLVAFLRWHRDTLELKCSGLSADALARRAVAPSALSLLGLLRHAAETERFWFRQVMVGEDAPALFGSSGGLDGAFGEAVADPELVTEAWEAWRAEVAFAERFTAEAPDLETVGHEPGQGPVSLRWVLLHVLEEYARHNGHADLLRERIDGAVGL